jgi:SAM-dependent methyltransferase
MTTHTWDATGYDQRFSFVTSRGADLLTLAAVQPGERVLDLGCGTGHQAAALAAAGAVAVGVDADHAMLEVARRTYPAMRFHHGDGQNLDGAALRAELDDRHFDVVLSNAALHWMPDQDAVVAGVSTLLRPGGRLVVEMGGAGNVGRLIESIRAGRRAVGLETVAPLPWTFPTPGEQASRLERSGFGVRLVQLFDRMTPLTAGDTAADWAAMFGATLVADVPAERRPDLNAALDARARDLGLAQRPDGEPGWWADYVRLRFVAELT